MPVRSGSRRRPARRGSERRSAEARSHSRRHWARRSSRWARSARREAAQLDCDKSQRQPTVEKKQQPRSPPVFPFPFPFPFFILRSTSPPFPPFSISQIRRWERQHQQGRITPVKAQGPARDRHAPGECYPGAQRGAAADAWFVLVIFVPGV